MTTTPPPTEDQIQTLHDDLTQLLAPHGQRRGVSDLLTPLIGWLRTAAPVLSCCVHLSPVMDAALHTALVALLQYLEQTKPPTIPHEVSIWIQNELCPLLFRYPELSSLDVMQKIVEFLRSLNESKE